MPKNTRRPFAYSVEKSSFVFSVRPTLASALEAARARFAEPALLIDITAWLPDGTDETVPYDLLCTADKSAWITSEDARQLEGTLYPLTTVRERVTDLAYNCREADYWERLVLRYAEHLLAIVDEDLRGIPVKEAGIEEMTDADYLNLPGGPIEFIDGFARPKRWILHAEGRRRLGFATMQEEMEFFVGKLPGAVGEEYARPQTSTPQPAICPFAESFSEWRTRRVAG
jgi:hypothetical protein